MDDDIPCVTTILAAIAGASGILAFVFLRLRDALLTMAAKALDHFEEAAKRVTKRDFLELCLTDDDEPLPLWAEELFVSYARFETCLERLPKTEARAWMLIFGGAAAGVTYAVIEGLRAGVLDPGIVVFVFLMVLVCLFCALFTGPSEERR